MLDPALAKHLPLLARWWVPLSGLVVALLLALLGLYVVRRHPVTTRERSVQRALEVSGLRGALGLPLIVVTGAAVVVALVVRPPFVGAWSAGLAAGLGATCGWWFACARVEQAVEPTRTFVDALRAEVLAVVASPWVVALVLATALAPHIVQHWPLAAVPLLALWAVNRWAVAAFRRKFVPSDRATEATRRAEALTGLRAQGVFHVPAERHSNAFLVPGAIVVFYGPILDHLDDDELTAIAVHELAHIPQAARRQRLVAAIAVAAVPLVFVRSLELAGWGWAVLGAAVISWQVSGRAGRRWALDEVEADRVVEGVGLAEPFGRALLHLSLLNDTPPNAGAIHRAVHLRVPAGDALSIDRRTSPAAPRLAAFLGVLVVCVVQALVGVLLVSSTDVATAYLALAEQRVREGNRSSVLELVHQAQRLSEHDPSITARAVLLVADAGQCHEARAMLSRAQAEVAHLASWPKALDLADAGLKDRCP